jgi:hypothetical protein
MKSYFSSFCLVLLLLSGVVKAESKIALVVSKAFKEDSISKKDLRRLYLGYLFYAGQRIQLAQMEGRELEKFLDRYIHVDLRDYKGRWTSKIFSGKSQMPRTFKDSDDMVVFLSDHDQAIGFLPYAVAKSSTSLKMLQVTP